jgi:hypothetical protein
MFVEDLSDGLRRKVRLALYRDVLVAVPIFKPLGETELEMLALSVTAEIYNPTLTPSRNSNPNPYPNPNSRQVTAEVYMPTDLVIKEGTSANELYVIGDGQLQVSRSDGLVVAVLGRGNFFGEMPFSNAPRAPPSTQTLALPPKGTLLRGWYLRISSHISPYLPTGEMALFHEDLKRNCNVAALSICDIYRINTTQIKAVLDENPALHRPATVCNSGCDRIMCRHPHDPNHTMCRCAGRCWPSPTLARRSTPTSSRR